MHEPLLVWARLLLRLAFLLLALGLVPLLLVGTILTGLDPLVPVLLSLTVAPLGAVCLLLAIILFLAARLRRRRGSS
jgi:hypothetical protein